MEILKTLFQKKRVSDRWLFQSDAAEQNEKRLVDVEVGFTHLPFLYEARHCELIEILSGRDARYAQFTLHELDFRVGITEEIVQQILTIELRKPFAKVMLRLEHQAAQ